MSIITIYILGRQRNIKYGNMQNHAYMYNETSIDIIYT